MGNSMGQTRTLYSETLGRTIQLTADGAPKYKAGGVTLDWASVPALVADAAVYMGVATTGSGANTIATFEDGIVVGVGEKLLRYGSPVVRRADGYFILGSDANIAAESVTLTRSEVYLVNESWLEEDHNSNHPGVIDGGRVFRSRVLAQGVPGAGAANDLFPTLTALEAVLPSIMYALD